MADGSIPQPANLLGQMALGYGGTGALPAVQRSQYLTEALQSMREHPPELRTAGALGSNLLAEALLRLGQGRSNQQLLSQIGQGAQGQVARASQGAYAPGDAPPMLSAPMAPPQGGGGILGGLHHLLFGGGAPAAQPAPQPAPQAPPQPAPAPGILQGLAANPPPAPGAAPAPSPTPHPAASPALTPDLIKLVQTVGGEARGEPPSGQAAVAAVAMNRAKATGQPLSAVVTAPGQFAGYGWGAQNLQDPSSPEFQRILKNIEPALNGYDPTNGADHFYAPRGMPGGRPPSWAVGQPYMAIGNHHFLSLGPQGQPPPNALNPFQIAGSPSPASPGPSSPGPAGGAPPATIGGPAGGAAPGLAQQPPPPMQAQQGPPTGPTATPGERAYIQRALSAPQGSMMWQAGLQKLQEIQQRAMTPLEAPKNMMWQGGRAAPIPGTETTQLGGQAPGEQTQVDPFGARTYSAVPNAVQGNQVYDQQQARYVPLAGLQPTVSGQFQNGTVVSQEPGKAPTVVQAPAFATSDVLGLRDKAQSSHQATDYQQSNDAWKAMQANAGKPNGMSSYALRDTFARAINPGAVARVGTIEAIRESAGLPENVKSFFLNLQGNGSVSPQLAQQTLDATLPFIQAHDQAMRQLNGANADLVKRHGLDPSDVLLPMDAPPQRYVIPVPQAPPGAPGLPAGVAANSQAAQIAQQLMARGYHFQNGRWTK